MSTQIISAIRSHGQLHGNKKFTAIEVGHLMNTSGYGRISYEMMGYKTGYSRRTAIRHMHALVAMQIFSKTVFRLANGYAINLYKCLLPIRAFYRAAPATTHGDNVTPILPPPKAEEEKSLALREEIRRQQWALDHLPMATVARESCQERLTQLLALTHPTKETIP